MAFLGAGEAIGLQWIGRGRGRIQGRLLACGRALVGRRGRGVCRWGHVNVPVGGGSGGALGAVGKGVSCGAAVAAELGALGSCRCGLRQGRRRGGDRARGGNGGRGFGGGGGDARG